MAARTLHHESPTERFTLVEGEPDPRLRGLVRTYEDFEEESAAPVRRREVAIPDVVVIVDFGEGWDVLDDAGRREHHGSFAAGVSDRPAAVEHAGRARCVQVNLTPLGGRALLGVPLSEVANRVVDLDDLLGPSARRLAERLEGAGSAEERFAILDSVLLARAAAAEPVRPDVAWAWRRLVDTGGAIGVADLAEELRCSRRHLSRRFGEEVGLPPKVFARLLRFRRATDALLHGGEPRLAEVAADCGFADQSHMDREFRAFAGTTPSALLAARVPGGGGVRA